MSEPKPSAIAGATPAMASEAVLVESQDMPEGSVEVNGCVYSSGATIPPALTFTRGSFDITKKWWSCWFKLIRMLCCVLANVIVQV